LYSVYDRLVCRLFKTVLGPAAVVGLVALSTVGCQSHDKVTPPTPVAAPGSTFSGEAYLRGTIGSYGAFLDNEPMLVQGYGMVVDLDATGSNEVPSFLREWLMTEMRRNNVGSVQFGTAGLSPQRALSDMGSSVVAVEGFIPPGAAVGTKFDVLVSMVDRTSSSLSGGRLFWPTALSSGGLNSRLTFTRTMGRAFGPMYVNPLATVDDANAEFMRSAIVVNGGTVTESRQVQLILNQRSFIRSRQITDRINERFPSSPTDHLPTAVAKSDLVVELNIPRRFSGDPEGLLELIAHLYLDPSVGFAPQQAARLSEHLKEQPEHRAASVVAAWKALGRTVLPVLREDYQHENLTVRFAALETGAWLQDRNAVGPLVALANGDDAGTRLRAAQSLVAISNVPLARRTVREMINDDDEAIRIGAYESLAMVDDMIIERRAVGEGENFKYFIDRVRCEKPMVYATQAGVPTIAVFGDAAFGDLSLNPRVFEQVGSSLMLRTVPADSIASATAGRYEGQTAFIPVHLLGAAQEIEAVIQTPGALPQAGPTRSFEVVVGDNNEGRFTLRIRGKDNYDQFREAIGNTPRAVPSEKPTGILMVRLVSIPHQDTNTDEFVNEYVGELLQVRSPEAALPLGVRFMPPGEREAMTYRINPTVATLAYTLGYNRDPTRAELGPDMPYSSVVGVLHALCESNQIAAPFEIHINEIAQAIEDAQQAGQVETRRDFDEDEITREIDTSLGPEEGTPEGDAQTPFLDLPGNENNTGGGEPAPTPAPDQRPD